MMQAIFLIEEAEFSSEFACFFSFGEKCGRSGSNLIVENPTIHNRHLPFI
jgi:hypothetical protein